MPPPETSPYRLLVEGKDDLNSVVHLLKRHNYNWDNASLTRPYIAAHGGVADLLEALPVTAKGSYSRVGVVLDADLSPSDRWEQLRQRMQSVSVALPEAPDPKGTVLAGIRPGTRLGFWLMPDNRSSGTLEGFLADLVPAENMPWLYADEATKEGRRRGAACKEKDHLKSQLHTWLAWQETPGIPFGTALTAQVFRHDSESANKFVDWFRALFVDP